MHSFLKKTGLTLTTAALAAGFTITAAAAPAHASNFSYRCAGGIVVKYDDGRDALIVNARTARGSYAAKVVLTPYDRSKGPVVTMKVYGGSNKTNDALKYAFEDTKYSAKITCTNRGQVTGRGSKVFWS